VINWVFFPKSMPPPEVVRQVVGVFEAAATEISDDELTILDVEHTILNGRIIERQRDVETGGWKYVVGGRTVIDDAMELVGRLSVSGKLVTSRCIVRKNLPMICDLCGAKAARVHRVTRSYGQGRDLLVVENVPVLRCSRCGGSYFTAATLHELHRIKSHRKALASKRQVPIARFAAA